MSTMNRARFQEAAVEHITARLTDPHGSRRFLLADEVGLGKTIVARGVIERLRDRKRSGPLHVIYLCSNGEIAEQNRRKLDPEAESPIGRITELARKPSASQRDVLLYSFTPGTSLREGTGIVWERRLLLYLIRRILAEDVSRREWREYFRCSAGEEGWLRDTRPRALYQEFARVCSSLFQDELGRSWRAQEQDGISTVRALRDGVAAFDGSPEQKRARNRVVGNLRGAMQRVALRTVNPDLVILDEIQRFRDVLDDAANPAHLASVLFGNRAPVLILSATPYRLFTLRHEIDELGESHEEFYRTIEFLFERDGDTPKKIRADLVEFGRRLRTIPLEGARDTQLLDLKREIETELRRVVCRTERNWYVLDQRSGVTERAVLNELPCREELEEYFRIRRGLGRYLDGTGETTEFWKSAPSVVSFLDANYALLRHLRADGVLLPRALLTDPDDVADLSRRNQRLRHLIDLAFGSEEEPPTLWTAPAYTYWHDQFFGAEPKRKVLVFSGWRFVPKVVAIVASRVASERLGGDADASSQPLRFSERGAFHVFDLCFPSPALAGIVNPRSPEPGRVPGDFSAEDLLEITERRLSARLRRLGVQIVDGSGDPMWRAVARLESAEESREAVEQTLRRRIAGEREESAPFQSILGWMQDNRSEVRLTRARLRHLTLVATFSPAVSLVRALCSVHSRTSVLEAFDQLVSLGFGALRNYLNRSVVQQAIRRHGARVAWTPARSGDEHGYAEHVLLYACDAHLLAVLDEYLYFLSHADQCDSPESAIERLGEVWSLSRGSRRSNGHKGRGDSVRIDPDVHVHATHFALAFGEDVARDAGPGESDGESMRKSIVRQAFNSPFWPFVLATTSIGQEGLDFHLYCRDVFHWNLPSNPVDLEQREGRILRRDGLAVRSSIARDWPLAEVAANLSDPETNPWGAVFARLTSGPEAEHDRHGLHPHWIYECREPPRTVLIERHVRTFAHSRDAARYERLKSGLALYRLVFGQPSQEDLLDDLHNRLEDLGSERRSLALRRLAGYMLNLSPIGREDAQTHALSVAVGILASDDRERLTRLLTDVHRLRAQHTAALDVVGIELDGLVALAESALSWPRPLTEAVRLAVAALVYLRDPHDHIFDLRGESGFDDDIEIIRDASRRLAAWNGY